MPCKRAWHVGKIPRKRSKEGEAGGRENGILSHVRRLPCRSETGKPGTSRGALGASERGGEAGCGAGAFVCGKGRMRAGGAFKERRAGACVHAHHLAHALLLYSMQGEKPGICLGERCAAQNGCGAADSVPDVCGGIKTAPYRQKSLYGAAFIWETQPICGRAARLAASCSSVGMVSVMVPLLKAS